MDKQIDKLINHIRDLENRLGEVDNNLRYIKAEFNLQMQQNSD